MADILARAEDLERKARLEFVWAAKDTEWPHHRREYEATGRKNWAEAERLREQIGAPPAKRYI